MGMILPAITGRIGTTDYWVTTMKAAELCSALTIPKSMDGWDDLTLEERYQRDINLTRVRKEIAPYFAMDKDRFTGSLIVAIVNHEEVEFESVAQLTRRLPAAYRTSMSGLGVLTLNGGEILVPLDGQHRTKAIQYAISGRDDQQKDIPDLVQDPSLGNEDIVVILIRYESKKARKIFNKVNQYARPTTKGQNLITDDDDAVAVIVRRHVVGEIVDSRLVRYGSANLNRGAVEFTTLATLYDASQEILLLKSHKPRSLPHASRHALWKDELLPLWRRLFEGIDHFRLATDDPTETGDDKRREIRETSILGKPIGQFAVVRAAVRLLHDSEFGRADLSLVLDGLNHVPWSVEKPIWQGVLMSGVKVKSGRTARRLAGDLIAYLVAGQRWGEESKLKLVDSIRKNLPIDQATHYRLPAPIAHPGRVHEESR